MGRKRPDIYQQQRELQHRAYLNARPFEDQYPHVEALTVHLTFTDPDGQDHPSPRDQTFSQGSRAHFAYACPFRECINGGFDLTSAVSDAVEQHLEDVSVRAVCDGWQDRERINKHQCLLACDYRINVKYKANGA